MDDYIVAKTKEADFIGQLPLAEITRQFHAGDLLGNYVATKSTGLSYQEIMQSGTATWTTVADLVWDQLTAEPLVSFTVAKQELAKLLAGLTLPLLLSFYWFKSLLPTDSALYVGIAFCFAAALPVQGGILLLLRGPRGVKALATWLRLIGAWLVNCLILILLTVLIRTWQEASSWDPLVDRLFYFFLWGLTIAVPTFAMAHWYDGFVARYLTDLESAPALSRLQKKIALGCGVAFLLCSWGVAVIEVLTAEPTGVDVHIETPLQVVLNGRFTIIARIKNTDKNPQTFVELDIASSYLAGITIERTEPPFSDRFRGPLAKWVSYSFERRVDPGGELMVTLDAYATCPGDYEGNIGFCINSALRCLSFPMRTTVTETKP